MPGRSSKLDTIYGRMSDLEHQEVDKDLNAMIYGGPGEGKTVLALELAQELVGWQGKIALLDSADGWVTLESPKHRHLKVNVDRYPLETPGDFGVIAEAVASGDKRFAEYEVVIVDEVSSIALDVLEDLERERQGVSEDEAIEKPDWGTYGQVAWAIGSACRKIRRVEGVHLILVSHSKTSPKTPERPAYTSPDMSESVTKSINKIMHLTVHLSATMKIKNREATYVRVVQSLPSTDTMAKTRIDLPYRMDPTAWVERVVDWSMSELAEGIEAEAGMEEELADNEPIEVVE